MKKNLDLILFFLFIVIFVGCTPVGENRAVEEENIISEDLLEEDWRFSTATAPPDPDLSGQILEVFLIGAVSEPFIEITTSISNGLQDGFDYLNSHGGISGARINYQFLGVRTYEEKLIETYQELVLEENPFLILLAAPVNQDFYEVINENEVPVFYYGVGGANLEKPDKGDYLFWLTPHQDQQFTFVLDQLWENWRDIRPQGTFNEVKIGYLSWEEKHSFLSLTVASRQFIDQNNFSLELEAEIPISANSSATNFLLDSVSEGVTVIYTDTFSFGPAVLWNDLHSLGLSEFFVVSGSQWLIGENIFEYVRNPSQDALLYFPLSIAWWTESENPAIINALEIHEYSERTQADQNVGYLLSLGAVDMIGYLLEGILEDKQNRDLNGQIIMASLSELEEYSVMDGLFEVDYSKNNRKVKEARLWSFSLEEGMTPVAPMASLPELSYVEE